MTREASPGASRTGRQGGAGGRVVPLRSPGSAPSLPPLDELQSGGPRAGALLYDTFAPDVNAIVWRLLGADPEHDDLVQAALLQVWRRIGTVRDPSTLKAWVRAVAVNTVRQELRRRRLRRMVLPASDALDQAPSDGRDDPENARLSRSTYACLEKLPTEERLALTLRMVAGHSLEEVARLCRCSLATAKRRIAGGQTKFKKIAARDPVLGPYLATREDEEATS